MTRPDDHPLTPERVLVAAEDVLRRYGPAKATVVDVARELGVSHASLYRHFPSKAALRQAVTRRWLERVVPDLERHVNAAGPASRRLRGWLETLIAFKRTRAASDPELFANYLQLAAEARDVVTEHRAALAGQLRRIVEDGLQEGEFRAEDPARAAQAILDATARFHDPAYAHTWSDPGIQAAFEGVWSLMLHGLAAP